MYRTSTRFASTVATSRAAALRQQRQYLPSIRQRAPQKFRNYATGAGATPPPPPPPPPPPQQSAASNAPMWIVLAAIAGVGAGGYYYLKPVRDVAHATNQAIGSAKQGGEALSNQVGGIAQAFLPPTALALYNTVSKADGGVGGFLTSLKDKDLQGVFDEVKKVGGDDVKRIMEKVEKKVKDAKGNVQNVDWMSLAQELKEELPKDKQHMVDTLIGKLPSKGDMDKYIKQLKETGEDSIKQVEQSAGKIWEKVEKARKEGKGQADAFLAGLKEAAPEDLDKLIAQLKEAAKKAGLPADQAEAWLKNKADEKKLDAEAIGKQFEDKLRQGAKFIPGEPKDFVKSVEQISPSLAKILQQAMTQTGITDEQGNRKK